MRHCSLFCCLVLVKKTGIIVIVLPLLRRYFLIASYKETALPFQMLCNGDIQMKLKWRQKIPLIDFTCSAWIDKQRYYCAATFQSSFEIMSVLTKGSIFGARNWILLSIWADLNHPSITLVLVITIFLTASASCQRHLEENWLKEKL